MEKPKRNNGTISFSDKSQKEEVQRILMQPNLQNLMPENIRKKDGLKVLWAVRYLKNLADTGKIRLEVPMFCDNSVEVSELETRIADLERSLYFCQLAVKSAAHKMRMPGYNPKTVIDECLMSVVANSPKFMGDEVPEDKDLAVSEKKQYLCSQELKHHEHGNT